MSDNSSKIRVPALAGAIISLIGIVVATLLVCKHLFPEYCSSSMGCSLSSGVDGCKELGQSRHSKILGGIPIALLGLFYYIFIFFLFLRLILAKSQAVTGNLSVLIFSFALFGLIVDGALAYKNYFVLVYPCMLCTYTYFATLGIFGAALFLYLNVKSETVILQNLSQALKATLIPLAGAVSTTVVINLAIMGLASSQEEPAPVSDNSISPAYQLLPPARRGQVIAGFNQLPDAGFDVKGIKTAEGSEQGYIVIHKFADLRCGHCRETSYLLKEVLQRWPDRIRIYYRQFPLDGSCNPMVERPQPGGFSCNGALASICSAEQGIFTSFYHGLFELQQSQAQMSPETLQDIATGMGGNWKKMSKCMGAKSTSALLKRDLKDAEKINISSTPTLVVNGKILKPGTPNKVYFFHLMDALVFEKEGEAAYSEFQSRKSQQNRPHQR